MAPRCRAAGHQRRTFVDALKQAGAGDALAEALFLAHGEATLRREPFLVALALQLCKIEPWAYLRDLFCLRSNWPAHQMLDLAPLNWAQTSARKDVRALLAANKFRDLTIDAG